MTLDDAAAILDVTEEHVKDLMREGTLSGYRFTKGEGFRIDYADWGHGFRLPYQRGTRAQRGQWFVNGSQVRARRRRLDR